MLRLRLTLVIVVAVLVSLIAIEAVIFVPSLFNVRDAEVEARCEGIESTVATAGAALDSGVPLSDALALVESADIGGFVVRDPAGQQIAEHGVAPEVDAKAGYDDGVIVHEVALGSLGHRATVRQEAPGVSAAMVSFTWRIVGLVLAIAAFVSVAVLLVFRRAVLQPLARLTRHASGQQAGSKDLSELMERPDEIGVLARCFRQFADDLTRDAQAAGAAESSATILHNIGNAVNSIGVRASSLAGNVEMKPLGYLDQLANTLEHRLDTGDLQAYLEGDPKGTRMLPFLRESVNHMLEKCREVRTDVEFIKKSVGHVAETITLHQSYSGVEGMKSECELGQIVRDSLDMLGDSFAKREMEGSFEAQEVPFVSIDRNMTGQVVLNLLKNAMESVETALQGDAERHRRVEVSLAHDPDEDLVRLRIRDTGAGIAPENLERIFGYRFSTKERSSGFGLHYCANFAQANGGSLVAENAPDGVGAIFTLSLPAVASAEVQPDVSKEPSHVA